MRHFVVPAAALLLAASAQADYSAGVAGTRPVAGDGQPVRQARYLDDEYIAIVCQTPVQLEISVGSKPAMEVSIDRNLQDLIRLRERDRTLYIDSSAGWTTGNQPVVRLALPQLERLELQGGAGASIDGFSHGEFTVTLGSGMLEVRGELDALFLNVNGNGDARLQDATVDRATVVVNGGGRVIVNAAHNLDATIKGKGSIRYRGDPEITRQISADGQLLRD